MKTVRCFSVFSPLLLILLTPLARAAEEAKAYTLFLGTDFAVQQDKEYYRVLDVVGGTFVIKVKDQEVQVPMRRGAGSLKVDQSFKLTPVAAQIDKLKTDRAYTEANDPYVKFNSKSGASLGADAAQQLNDYKARELASYAAGQQQSLGEAKLQGDPNKIAAAGILASQAESAASLAAQNTDSSAYQQIKADINNPGQAAFELQQELAEENFDAMRYSFEVSSPTPLNRPYLMFILRYHEKDAKPGTHEGTVIYAKSIAPIADRPSKINILQTGMPVGFIVDECQVRLYNGGQEVATNIAPRRVAMSRDEAFLYLKIDRISRAKGVTLPAAPALGRLDEETKSRLTLDQLKQTYYVKVSKEGRAEQVFLDAACTQPADATVTAIIENVRFYPALEKSKEQAGTAKLLFSQIPI